MKQGWREGCESSVSTGTASLGRPSRTGVDCAGSLWKRFLGKGLNFQATYREGRASKFLTSRESKLRHVGREALTERGSHRGRSVEVAQTRAEGWHWHGNRAGMSSVPPSPLCQPRPWPPSSPGNFFPSSVLVEEIVLSSTDCGAHCPPCNTCMFLRPRHLGTACGALFAPVCGRGGGERQSGLFVCLCCSLAASTDIMPVFFLLLLLFFQVGAEYSCTLRRAENIPWVLLPCRPSLLHHLVVSTIYASQIYIYIPNLRG